MLSHPLDWELLSLSTSVSPDKFSDAAKVDAGSTGGWFSASLNN